MPQTNQFLYTSHSSKSTFKTTILSELFDTFSKQLAELSSDTLIYPGHDYITNNLEFTLDREPDNQEAERLLEKLKADHDPDHAIVTSLAQEKLVNTFFRLTSESVINRLRESFPDLSSNPDEREVFIKLRELGNSW